MTVGRPREFDPEQVEDVAMRLFWERGYDAVSISDLTAATGANRRSIYAEFGSKEELFDRALQRYLAGPGGYVARALTRATAREVAEAMVHGAADATSGEPRGCLLLGDGAGLAGRRCADVQDIARRGDAAVAAGQLADVDTMLLAGGSRLCVKGFRCRLEVAQAVRNCTRWRIWPWRGPEPPRAHEICA